MIELITNVRSLEHDKEVRVQNLLDWEYNFVCTILVLNNHKLKDILIQLIKFQVSVSTYPDEAIQIQVRALSH